MKARGELLSTFFVDISISNTLLVFIEIQRHRGIIKNAYCLSGDLKIGRRKLQTCEECLTVILPLPDRLRKLRNKFQTQLPVRAFPRLLALLFNL